MLTLNVLRYTDRRPKLCFSVAFACFLLLSMVVFNALPAAHHAEHVAAAVSDVVEAVAESVSEAAEAVVEGVASEL